MKRGAQVNWKRILIGAFAGISGIAGVFCYMLGHVSVQPELDAIEAPLPQTTAGSATRSRPGPIASASSLVPHTFAPLLARVLDTSLSYTERVAVARELSSQISAADVDTLRAFLKTPGPEDDDRWTSALKNEAMNQLCKLDPVDLRQFLTALYQDQSQSCVIRDYAIQHLVEYYLFTHREIPGAETEQVANVLWSATEETDSSIAGTALLGLSRLGSRDPSYQTDRVAETANRLAADNTTLPFIRTAAIQVCTQMGVTDALPAIWDAAETGNTIPLRASAIAALGLLNQTNAVPWLTDIANGSVDYLKPAANRALRQIALAKQRELEAVLKELERQQGEQLRREKEARRHSTTF